ncbi:uncharacterized protein F5891DRAFT_979044 [Suillus fuscotomentosus]|uniref:Uncharacterized protein n=1 Tax=Suillus fuscotomentosus TaxID=1912939 RepID=A0AAD4HNP6_9AGAM|nr:uncharacterized protein F5891DRAFT_979044 [Suillus fuscotomentosus]KAG1901919.1 hypothetical protein F5891DRAFT_979044 [Suillus fuscotomentosus]
MSTFQANATRRPPIRPAPRRVPQGFFDDVQYSGPSSTTHPDPPLHRLRNAFALSWGSHPRALLAGIPSLFHRSPPNTDEPNEPQQRPRGPGTSSRRSPPVVDVPALDDKKALYVSRRPERAGDKAKRVDTSKWWARVVLFLCLTGRFARQLARTVSLGGAQYDFIPQIYPVHFIHVLNVIRTCFSEEFQCPKGSIVLQIWFLFNMRSSLVFGRVRIRSKVKLKFGIAV